MDKSQSKDEVSVSEYLDILNEGLRSFDSRVIGEVIEVQLYPDRKYLFFKIKDKDNPALLTCFMWKRDYNLSGVELEVGLEIIISGTPSIYKALGRLSFQTQTVELVGEGQLKKAYDELKTRLDKEGLFRDERKRSLPVLPQKIGLVTSKDGAVIGDFQMNLGNFGFKVTFVDSRVEGQLAVAELLSAIRTLKKKDIEVLVLVRGGGSLESLLSFNNEALVREIVNFPVPVLVGVGHEKDISLVALAADKMVSTSTATAQALNESWQQALAQVQLNQHKVSSLFSEALSTRQSEVQASFQTMRNHFQSIFDNFSETENAFLRVAVSLRSRLSELRRQFNSYPEVLARGMRGLVVRTQTHLSAILESSLNTMTYAISGGHQSVVSFERVLKGNNPERQLKLGYSIVRSGGAVVRSVAKVQKGQNIEIRVQDGSFKSDVTEIIKNV